MSHTPLPSEMTEEGRAFLQRRASIFNLTFGAIGGGFFSTRVVEGVVHGLLGQYMADPTFLLHAAAVALNLLVGLSLRRGRPSTTFIRWAEGAGLVGGMSLYAGMASFIPAIARPEFLLLLIFYIGIFARVIYVPSTARLTLLLASLMGVTLLVVVHAVYSNTGDLSSFRQIDPSLADASDAEVVRSLMFWTGQWWVAAAVLATLSTRAIYGLRREAAKARQLGQYTLIDKLGEGGMGAVYRARHAMLRRPTAVKLLLPEKSGEVALKRFEREVQLTASLTHPNTITVFDYGRTPDDVFYYAMELLDGPTLQAVVARDGTLPAPRVLHLMGQVAGALEEAHSVGLIHRDVKPANLMLVGQAGLYDQVKVLDFGLVRDIQNDGDGAVTHADSITGTPTYMSPEAILHPDDVDGRSDLYGLGCVAYYLLTGRDVFQGESVVEVCSHHLHTPPEKISAVSPTTIPDAVEAVFMRCLAKDPEDRPPDAGALRRELATLAKELPWTEAEAEAWWHAYREECPPELGEPRSHSGPGTVEIDLARV